MIILFDGICNLCNGVVRFIIRHDKKAKFRFASLQSEKGKMLLKEYELEEDLMNSIVFIRAEKAYIQSDAALEIAKNLDYPWKILYGFVILPGFVRNGIYKLIARNRYSIFGKNENCMVADERIKERFLE